MVGRKSDYELVADAIGLKKRRRKSDFFHFLAHYTHSRSFCFREARFM